MLLLTVRQSNRGMTLIEILIVAVLMGIIAAIGIPNLLQMLNNNKINASLDLLQNTLRDVQRQSIRQSKNCTINFAKDSNPPRITESTAGCLSEGMVELDKGVIMKANLTNTTFSFKGNTTLSGAGTIVLEASDGDSEKKCLVISSGLGILRTGIYTPDPNDANKVSAENCDTSL